MDKGVTFQQAILLGLAFGFASGVGFYLITNRGDIAALVGLAEAVVGVATFPMVMPRRHRRW